jgi:hypothetical protein
MMTLPLQWIAVAALGCVGVDDVSGNDARLLGPEAANRIRIEWRSTLPLVETIWPVLTPPSLDEPVMPSRSGCSSIDDREGQG